MDWLREIDLLEITLVKSTVDYRKHFNVFKVTDRIDKLLVPKLKPLNIPDKIPMIVKPKQFLKGSRNLKDNNGQIEQLGGYLLNKELTLNELIIPN
jgi:hypothetical protein